MTNLDKLLNKMIEILNNNEICQSMMENLSRQAIEKGMTPEDWQQFKQQMFLSLFIKLYQEHKDIQEIVIKDAYEMLKAE